MSLSPNTISDLFNELGNTVSLRGAQCTSNPTVFDPPEKGGRYSYQAERQALALALCAQCPVLVACAAHWDSLAPSQRPWGVVAGQLVRRNDVYAATLETVGMAPVCPAEPRTVALRVRPPGRRVRRLTEARAKAKVA
jgi:hypothetical protein